MNDKILKFLYKWVKENKLPQIRKGMPEDLEEFIYQLFAEEEQKSIVERIIRKDESNE